MSKDSDTLRHLFYFFSLHRFDPCPMARHFASKFLWQEKNMYKNRNKISHLIYYSQTLLYFLRCEPNIGELEMFLRNMRTWSVFSMGIIHSQKINLFFCRNHFLAERMIPFFRIKDEKWLRKFICSSQVSLNSKISRVYGILEMPLQGNICIPLYRCALGLRVD